MNTSSRDKKDVASAISTLGVKSFKVLHEVCDNGYDMLLKGYRSYNEWRMQLRAHTHDLLSQLGFSEDNIDELFEMVWDSTYTYYEETLTMREWAAKLEAEEVDNFFALCNMFRIDSKNVYERIRCLGHTSAQVIFQLCRIGHAVICKGFYDYARWRDEMRRIVSEVLLILGFSEPNVDEFIAILWHYPFTFNGETHDICVWAVKYQQEAST